MLLAQHAADQRGELDFVFDDKDAHVVRKLSMRRRTAARSRMAGGSGVTPARRVARSSR
jgi:hypothetical protein